MSSSHYLAVLKAVYDYESPQSDDELAIKEDQVLFLIERVDEDWWKVKIKPDSPDEDGPSGLVPAAYVEEVPHKHVVKALYDYDANASGELTVKEDEILYSYETDEGWTLVKSKDNGSVGYVPGNYIEQTEEDGHAADPPSPSPSPPPPAQPAQPISPPPTQSIFSNDKSKIDDIQTWSISELDKKGKKKKGTLGIGNGAVFFASETDKTPVQKWAVADVDAVRTEKGKHVVVEIGGAEPLLLRFHAGSKDTAEAIVKKMERSIDLSNENPKPVTTAITTQATPTPPTLPPIETTAEDAPKKNSVHFAVSSPSIITRSEDGEEDVPEGAVRGVALYDFTAGGDDELTVNEGDQLLVLDRSSEDWWTCSNQHGLEGVVPASYIELAQGVEPVPVGVVRPHDDDGEEENELNAAREAAEREELLRQEEEERELAVKKEGEEREAKRKKEKAEALAKDTERKLREQERRRATEAEAEAEAAAAAEEAKKEQQRREREKERERVREKQAGQRRPDRKATEKPRSLPKQTRTWHDKTGQFQVDAEFLGQSDNKIRLHKSNGVIIEVPISKMSSEDVEYIRRLQRKAAAASRSNSRLSEGPNEDDVPLAALSAASSANKRADSSPRTDQRPPPNKGPIIDWFEFFLNAGCDIDECTRYASSFERDKIDESLLPELKDGTLRSLGLKEGDILRVLKAIQQRTGSPPNKTSDAERSRQSQMEEDEKLARQLQAQETGGPGDQSPRQGSASPAPNLFSGPGGVLKNNTRRGRPQPSKSAPPLNVDIDSIGGDSQPKLITDSQTLTPVQAPKRTTSVTPSQFDDDAWTNRPSSTVPIAPSSTTPQPSTSAVATLPPAPAPTSAQASVTAPTTQSPPSQTPPPITTSPINTKDSNFELLAKISAMRPAVTHSPPVASPPIQSPPPPTFQTGLGVGGSMLPISQHLQNQQTGLYNLQPQPRGPPAPTAANQPLLNPLIPTNTGFNSFVPTRPGTNPPPVPPLPSFLSNPPNFRPQSNPTNPILAQPTGFPSGGFGGLQPQPTGFIPSGFGGYQSNFIFNGNGPAFQSGLTGPSPGGFPTFTPPTASPPPDNHSPANIFAQMKSGTFGKEDAAQPADKYDALRTNEPSQLLPQPTGWGAQPTFSQPNFSAPYSGFGQR